MAAKKGKSAAQKAKSAGTKAKKKKSSSNSSSSKSSSQGGINRLDWETGTGIAFMGSMAAQVVHDVLFRFILGDADLNRNTGRIDLLYHYRFFIPDPDHKNESHVQYLDVRKLMDVDIPDDAGQWISQTNNRYNIFNPDEAMNRDPTEFLQYEGNIAQFVRDLANIPFNEIYWTHEEEDDHQDTLGDAQVTALNNIPPNPYDPNPRNGILEQDPKDRIPHATFHFRQTPFTEDRWVQLPKIYVDGDDVIDMQIDNNDEEQASVFNITNRGTALPEIANLPPVTDDRQELVRHYGYKYMDISSEYFMNTQSQIDMNTSDLVQAIAKQDQGTMPADATLTYPSATTFNDYFGPDAATQLLKSKDPHLSLDVPMSPEEGGEQLYYLALSYLSNHLEQFLVDKVEYEISQLFVAYINSPLQSNPLKNQGQFMPGVPVDQVNNMANQLYNNWQNDLRELQEAYQQSNNKIDASLDSDEAALVTNPDNVYRLYDNGQYIPVASNDPVITYQKAGQLMMHYMLAFASENSGDQVNSVLHNQALTALNPWLGQVEKPPTNNKKNQGAGSNGQTPQAATQAASLVNVMRTMLGGA